MFSFQSVEKHTHVPVSLLPRGSHLSSNPNWPFKQLCNRFANSRLASSQLNHISRHNLDSSCTCTPWRPAFIQTTPLMMVLIVQWGSRRRAVSTCKWLVMAFGCHDDGSSGEVWLQGSSRGCGRGSWAAWHVQTIKPVISMCLRDAFEVFFGQLLGKKANCRKWGFNFNTVSKK